MRRKWTPALEPGGCVSGIKVKKVGEAGEFMVSVEANANTVSAVASYYSMLSWELHQLQSVAAQGKYLQSPRVYTAQEARRDFAGTRMLDFANDQDLTEVINGSRPTDMAAEMIGRVMYLSPETVVRYSKLARQRRNP